jgi:hypothetical protein
MLDVYANIDGLLRRPPKELLESGAWSNLLARKSGRVLAAITTTYRYFGGEPMLRIPRRDGLELDAVISAIIKAVPGAEEKEIEWHGFSKEAILERAILLPGEAPIRLYVKSEWEYDHSFHSYDNEAGSFERFIFDKENYIVSMKREIEQRVIFSAAETLLVKNAFRKAIEELFGTQTRLTMYFLVEGLEHHFEEALERLSERFTHFEAREVTEVLCTGKPEYRAHAPVERYQRVVAFDLPDGDSMTVLVAEDECGQPLMFSRDVLSY